MKMKKISVFVLAAAALCTVTASCDSKKSVSNVKLANAVDSVSYSIGVNFGAGLKQQMTTFPGGESNIDALIDGFVTAMKDSAGLKMTPEAAQAFVQDFMMNIQMKEAATTQEEGEKFLAENKTKSGVVTTASGLQYQVITEGTGAKPTAESSVKVNYTGKLLDGTVFDTSEGKEPIVFNVNQVIPGWTEVLQLMPVGSKYTVWIPSNLAYGPNGAGQVIKPNSTLMFEVELLGIEK